MAELGDYTAHIRLAKSPSSATVSVSVSENETEIELGDWKSDVCCGILIKFNIVTVLYYNTHHCQDLRHLHETCSQLQFVFRQVKISKLGYLWKQLCVKCTFHQKIRIFLCYKEEPLNIRKKSLRYEWSLWNLFFFTVQLHVKCDHLNNLVTQCLPQVWKA